MDDAERKRCLAFATLTGEPYCPRCGGTNGSLGTSSAYFMCEDCDAELGQRSCYYYGTPDHLPHPADHGMTWEDAVHASPFGQCTCDRRG